MLVRASSVRNDISVGSRNEVSFRPAPSPHSWIPFGGGLRRCPGAAYAHMEMDIVLRTLARNVELDSTARRGERWLFRGLAFAPARGGRAAFRRRALAQQADPLGSLHRVRTVAGAELAV
jgi:hypothetical protein